MPSLANINFLLHFQSIYGQHFKTKWVCAQKCVYVCPCCCAKQSMSSGDQADGLIILRVVGSNENQHTKGFVSLSQTHDTADTEAQCNTNIKCQHYTRWLTHFASLIRINFILALNIWASCFPLLPVFTLPKTTLS